MSQHKMTMILILTFATGIASAATSGQGRLLPDTSSNRERAFDVSAATFGFVVDDGKHEQDFADAMEQFRAQKHADAAEEIRKVSSYLEVERGRATREGADVLKKAASELKKTSDKIAKHESVSADNLSKQFAKTDWALAEHHYLVANRDWHDADPESNPGKDIDVAAADIAAVYAWLAETPPADVTAELDRAKEAGAGLNGNISYEPAAIDSALAAIDKMITGLKSKLAT